MTSYRRRLKQKLLLWRRRRLKQIKLLDLRGIFSLGLEAEIRDSKLIIHRARVPDCGQDKD